MTGLLAAGIERVVLRPLIGRPVFVTVIVTIFIGLILRVLLILIYGPETRGMPTPWPTDAAVQIAGVSVLYNAIAAVALGAIALTAFALLLHYSRVGIAMRAAALDAEAALGHAGLNYGELRREEIGLTPLYLRYNTGRTVAETGQQFAEVLEAFC